MQKPTLLNYVHTHTHTFNGPLSGTIQVSRYQKGKPIWISLKQETLSGSGFGLWWLLGLTHLVCGTIK